MLVLVRHGRTEANASGLLLGRADVGLDEIGVEQAGSLAGALTGMARVISSPLRRCVETAEALGYTPEIDERWIELDYGELDQRPTREVPPEVWRAWRRDPHFVPGGGESLSALHDRVIAACEELAEEARTTDIAVVSHVSPIKAAVAWAIGSGVELSWRLHLDPASVTRIVVGPNGPVLLSFNEGRGAAG
jgi:broad specificity phosphatase PhoE